MDRAQRHALIKNRVELVSQITNLPILMNKLMETYTLTGCMIETIQVCTTNHEKVAKLLDILASRGPNSFYYFLEALDVSGNAHVADLLRKFCGYSKPEEPSDATSSATSSVTSSIASFVKTDICLDLTNEIINLRPVQTSNDRSNNQIYKVSVSLYQHNLPKSQVGQTELPYVAAIYKGIPKASVMKWPGCPSVPVLDQSFEVYVKELESVKRTIKAIGSGGILIWSNYIGNVLKVINVPIAVIDIPSLDLEKVSQEYLTMIYILFHLMFYGSNLYFIIRKDANPKPSSYLLYNVKCIDRANVVMDQHRPIVQSFLTEDENQPVPELPEYSCPF